MSILEKLTEGIRTRRIHMKQSQALVKKWEQSGLLKGLGGKSHANMALLLENQAVELLRETPKHPTIEQLELFND